jgi:hypothetical protein
VSLVAGTRRGRPRPRRSAPAAAGYRVGSTPAAPRLVARGSRSPAGRSTLRSASSARSTRGRRRARDGRLTEFEITAVVFRWFARRRSTALVESASAGARREPPGRRHVSRTSTRHMDRLDRHPPCPGEGRDMARRPPDYDRHALDPCAASFPPGKPAGSPRLDADIEVEMPFRLGRTRVLLAGKAPVRDTLTPGGGILRSAAAQPLGARPAPGRLCPWSTVARVLLICALARPGGAPLLSSLCARAFDRRRRTIPAARLSHGDRGDGRQ